MGRAGEDARMKHFFYMGSISRCIAAGGRHKEG